MAKLICHHTYGGIPGVVVDLSPRAASHGQGFGLDDGDFLADGSVGGRHEVPDILEDILSRPRSGLRPDSRVH
jgi:hypothetical protein